MTSEKKEMSGVAGGDENGRKRYSWTKTSGLWHNDILITLIDNVYGAVIITVTVTVNPDHLMNLEQCHEAAMAYIHQCTTALVLKGDRYLTIPWKAIGWDDRCTAIRVCNLRSTGRKSGKSSHSHQPSVSYFLLSVSY